MREHVTVVGAGVIGLCTAFRLRQRGVDVTVVDRGRAGAGASWGNAGWIVPSLSAPLAAPGAVSQAMRALVSRDGSVRLAAGQGPSLLPWLIQFARRCNSGDHLTGLRSTAAFAMGAIAAYDALAADGVAFQMRHEGLLSAFLDGDKAEAGRRDLALLDAFGYSVPDLLDGSALRALEPALSPEVQAGYLVPQERVVDPASLVDGLRTRLLADGVTLVEDWPVTTLERAGDRVVAVSGPAGRISTSQLVVTAGPWTSRLLRRTGAVVPLQAGKGYSFTLQSERPLSRPVYLPEGKLGMVARGAGVRIAGTMDLDGLDERPRARRVAAVHRTARQYLSVSGTAAPTEQWCGLRSVTPDGLPVMDRVPGLSNVTVGCGHAMLGVTLAPLSGAALAGIALGDAPSPLLAPFRANRFGSR